MPLKTDRYPQDWPVISWRIRNIRAKNKCENCGAPNKVEVKRLPDGSWRKLTEYEQHELSYLLIDCKLNYFAALRKLYLTKIVLTVAHLDHDESNNADFNLKALCQKCHFSHDKKDNRIRQVRSKQII
jgi:hypothetical protein